jgi:hypothetical protein
MALYQEIMNVPGLTGSAFQRQGQLYSKLGAPKGAYTGSYDQNVWLLGQVKGGNFGAAPAPAAAPPSAGQKSAQQLYDERVAADNAARQAMLDRQNSEQDSLFGEYGNKLETQERGTAMFDRLSRELGINDLGASAQAIKGQIYGVKDLLDRLDEDVNSRTSGTMTSDAMARRIKAHEGGELNTQLGRLTTGLAPVADMLSSAQGMLGTKMQLETADQQKELEPLKMRINSLSDRYAREITGFEQSHEDTLNNLLNKLERERTLADREWQLTQQLAAEQREFQRQKELATMQLSKGGGGGGGGMLVGGGGGASKPSGPPARQSQFQSRMAGLLDNYQKKYNAGYTERTVIPMLQKEFPEFAAQVPGMVYGYRKAVYGE